MNPIAIVIIVILVLLALGGFPAFGLVNHGYGYYPSGLFTLIVVVLLILILTGKL